MDEKIINTLLALKRAGYSEGVLNNPESVKAYIADKLVEDSFKQNLVWSYDHYAQVNGISWVRPRY